MRLSTLAPGAALRRFVEVFWFVRGAPDYTSERVLPMAC
jgi:hypothetical protein